LIEPAVLFGLALIVGILTFVLLKTKKIEGGQNRQRSGDTALEQRNRPCPLCGTLLKKGERVKSVIYPSKGDTLAEVYGCPHCYGQSATELRICPVCKKPVSEDGYVIGRMFKEGRHLHVLGCTGCRNQNRRR
jgi:hypothetical protein